MKLSKKLFVLVLCIIFLITASNINTFAFLSYKTSDDQNSITTGQFPKPFARFYASIGPLYKNYFGSSPEYQSPSYRQWLSNACTYILDDLDNKTPKGAIGQNYSEFKMIPSDNTDLVDVKDDTSSPEFRNWWDKKLNPCNNDNEYGSLMHNIVVIGTPIREGISFGKIDISSCSLQITQQDIFQSIKNKDKDGRLNEYALPRDSKELNPAQNANRIVTYDFINGSYVKTGTVKDGHYTHAKEADLIIYDMGSEGYSVISCQNSGQDSLNYLQHLLDGIQAHASYSNKGWSTPWTDKMRDLVLTQMVPKNDLKCRLDRTECTLTFLYNGYQLPLHKYTVNYKQYNSYCDQDECQPDMGFR